MRVGLSFNAQIPLERVILERLSRLNRSAREVWLRGLILEGFLLESRVVRTQHDETVEGAQANSRRSAPFVLTPPNPQPSDVSAELAPRANGAIRVPDDNPFAALRRVIG